MKALPKVLNLLFLFWKKGPSFSSWGQFLWPAGHDWFDRGLALQRVVIPLGLWARAGELTASPHLCCPLNLSTIQEDVENSLVEHADNGHQCKWDRTLRDESLARKLGLFSLGYETILVPTGPPIFQDLQTMRVSWKELFEKPRDTWIGLEEEVNVLLEYLYLFNAARCIAVLLFSKND